MFVGTLGDVGASVNKSEAVGKNVGSIGLAIVGFWNVGRNVGLSNGLFGAGVANWLLQWENPLKCSR